MNNAIFSDTLLMLRKKSGLSQKQLADAIGVSQASVNYWEKGERTPSIDMAQKIAKYFNIQISELIGSSTASLIDDITKLFSNSSSVEIDVKGSTLNTLFSSLNDEGKDKAIEQVEMLTKIPEYQKKEQSDAPELAAAHIRTDVEPTPEAQAHDDAIMNDDSEWE